MVKINHHPSSRELRWFAGLWLPATCCVVAFWIARADAWGLAYTVVGVGVGLGSCGLVFPPLMRPVFIGLSYATLPIGWVLSWVVLAGIYYLLLTPTGLVLRLLGRDSMGLKAGEASSYWESAAGEGDVETYFRQS
jgi:hypothetical protein